MDDLASTIHSAGFHVVAAVTGGGAELLGHLFARAGASRAMVAASIPYHPAQLERYLCRPVPTAVSAEISRALACRARQQAMLAEGERAPLGFGCSAALATTRSRRGEEEAFLAVATENTCLLVHLVFEKGRQTRSEQEQILCAAGLETMAAACAGRRPDFPALRDGVRFQVEQAAPGDPLHRFLGGASRWISIEADGRQHEEGPVAAAALLPGSFNPLHQGHLGMADAAERLLGAPVVLELSTLNADKSAVAVTQLRRRLCAAFRVRSLVLTRAATFIEKARLFPGKTWVVGADTAKRVVNPKYYGSEADRAAVFREFAALGSGFLVMGRSEAGLFKTLEDVALPAEARPLFRAVPEAVFRADLSSTEIRQRAAAAARR